MIETMTPAVYILCGIPFSGKSTLARTLAMQRGWTHVDVDGIARSLIDSEESDVTEEQWTEAFNTSFEQISDSLARGKSVVHDATNFARTARDRVRAIALQSNASAHVIYIDIPVDQADRRRIANQGYPQRHQVSAAGFQEVVRSMEPPGVDESVLLYDGTMDVKAWIDRFICD